MESITEDIIYLDYAATTPTDPRVVEAMLPFFTQKFGNAASRTHAYGWEAEEAVKVARTQVADLIGAKPEEIIFTSGATEAINLALKGVYENYQAKGNHIITVATEHKAVLDTCYYLESQGADVTYLPVDQNGLISLEDLQKAFTERTILVSVMYANNETGVIQPIAEIADMARKHNALFMTDATQAVGKIPVDVLKDEIDILACSAHKLYGPNGVGALFVKSRFPRIKLIPHMHGGGHERGFRSGTLNTPAIVGFGKACELAKLELKNESERLLALRMEIEEGLKTIEKCRIHAQQANRLPTITNVYFEGIDAEALIIQLRDKLAVASGSACTSAEVTPSHVLMEMYSDEDIAYSSVRLSFGHNTTHENIKSIVTSFEEALSNITYNF
ncbi:cysteine desulfurase family protein [Pontibacter anaerobius]|uniref:cysteine desulfurase n=1 Tax=Pontibacter anaerobius TaxID=2993940 RepID=A0ABT3RI26_9BACT|nr:cysteine desulfurase family protein [Pontibacter anaerobius]MCX2741455.1 cysteine desulfurase family protein [Pontibacter anaerobius]